MMLFDLESSLDTSANRYDCPECGKKTLTKYVYNCSKKYVGDEFGKCDRGDYCGYHSMPSYNFYYNDTEVIKKELHGVNGNYMDVDNLETMLAKPLRFTHTIPEQYLVDSMCNIERSNFAKFLISHLNDGAIKLLEEYFVGLSEEEDSTCNIFWKIDNNLIIRAGIISHFKEDGSRGKIICYPHLYQPYHEEYNYLTCFFGAHLINFYPEKAIALVQDEMVAIVCSHFWPEYNWLATGIIKDLHWREYEVYNVLANKNVTMFSDYDLPVLRRSTMKMADWKEMAEYIETNIPCSVKVKYLVRDKFNTLDEERQKILYFLLKWDKSKDNRWLHN